MLIMLILELENILQSELELPHCAGSVITPSILGLKGFTAGASQLDSLPH
jgi:hypothetical protein